MENQTTENFHEVGKPKVTGTDNLDKATRLHNKSLDWFVVFSSAVAHFGNLGVANYGYANSYMERVCEQRIKDGLPGTR